MGLLQIGSGADRPNRLPEARMEPPVYFTVKECADLAGVSEADVLSAIRDGRLVAEEVYIPKVYRVVNRWRVRL